MTLTIEFVTGASNIVEALTPRTPLECADAGKCLNPGHYHCRRQMGGKLIEVRSTERRAFPIYARPLLSPAPLLIPTREAWLRVAVELFRPWFAVINRPLPKHVRISCGWGASGARAENATILGVTLRADLSADAVSEVFISPEDADAGSMLETVLHELVHVQDNIASGHRGAFVETAKALGFRSPWTETPPTPALTDALVGVARMMGAYPGAQITIPKRSAGGLTLTSAGNGQTNRHGLLKCPIDGYAVRTTKKWMALGMPFCPAGHQMAPADAE